MFVAISEHLREIYFIKERDEFYMNGGWSRTDPQ